MKVIGQTSIATFPRREQVHISADIPVASFPGPHGLGMRLRYCLGYLGYNWN